IEERKARALRDAGFDMDLDGRDSHSIQYQNANNSVRVTDEFMQAVLEGSDWHLRALTTGEVLQTVKARDLFRQIAKAAWECADPGMQFDTTINRWHTAPVTGRINASNPCCFVGETLVLAPGTDLRSVGRADRVRSVKTVELDDEVPVYDLEVEAEHNFAVVTSADSAVIVHNSEYMHLDNSACNLASLNLLKFLESD